VRQILSFVAHVTNAEFCVNCLASPDAEPDALLGGCNASVRQEVLIVLDICTGLAMDHVVPACRLGSPERRQNSDGESKRKLQSCADTDLNSGNQMMRCMQDDSFLCCGSPSSGGRRLEDTSEADTRALHSERCTAAFQALADARATVGLARCLGPSDEVFCRCFMA
jgi:hypothetical protein